MTDVELLALARRAAEWAYAPYSGYRVGAVLLAETGETVTGANVENASYGLTVCAERVAVGSAVSRGLSRFRALAVFADGEEPPLLCGACLQVVAELAPDLRVLVAARDGVPHVHELRDLLPHPFRGKAAPAGRGRSGAVPPAGAPDLAPLLESTLLAATTTAGEIEALCREAIRLGFGAVVVPPVRVEQAAGLLRGTPVEVVTVAGFPLGGSDPRVKAREAEIAFDRGAQGVDFVIQLGALREGARERVAEEMRLMSGTARGRGHTKAILECSRLSPEETAAACRLAEDAGIDFVKTGTGYGPVAVTVDQVRQIRASLGPRMRVKAAGGIREASHARALAAAGASRLGTSHAARIASGEGSA